MIFEQTIAQDEIESGYATQPEGVTTPPGGTTGEWQPQQPEALEVFEDGSYDLVVQVLQSIFANYLHDKLA